MDDTIRDSRPVRNVLMRCPQGDPFHLQEQGTERTWHVKYLKQPDGISYDVYNIEVIIAVAFRICSKESVLFRRFIINEISTIKKATPITLFVASVRGNNRWYS